MRHSFNAPIWYDHRNKCYRRGKVIIKGPYKKPRKKDDLLGEGILEARYNETLNDSTALNHDLVRQFELAKTSFTHLNPLKEVRQLLP